MFCDRDEREILKYILQTLRQATDAGGLGAHGLSASIGPDPLFSQGAIKASAAGNIVATVNPGSNTLSVFKINPDSPSEIQMIGEPVSSEGEFPMSLAINANGTQVCALNGGNINGVRWEYSSSSLLVQFLSYPSIAATQ